MDPERWQRIESIFQKALDAGEDRRARVLLESCAGDESLRREVESLLAQHQNAAEFMERPAFAGSARAPLPPRPRSEDSHSARIPAGTVIGHYRIVGKIGSGGMGVVYDAEDLKLGRHVALKFLPEEVAGQPRVLQRFRLEAQAASALNHPNICTIHEVDEVDGLVFIVMELLEGQTLKQTISDKPLPLETVIDFGVQIAGAIDAAHAKGVVHRDIKPANIFVMKQRRIKVLDFGLAKLTRLSPNFEEIGMTGGTEPGMVMGTVGYMSPEQLRGKGVDGRTDIFAFGAILYEMLAGRRAFEKPTSAETMAAILNEEPPAISELAPNTPPALVRLVKRCLEKDPEQRFQSASDLAFALQALPESSGVMTSAGVKHHPPRRFSLDRPGEDTRPRLPVRPRLHSPWIAVAISAVGLAVLNYWLLRPPARPIATGYAQITNDGRSKVAPVNLFATTVTDGSRLYFGEFYDGHWSLAQASALGGETVIISAPFNLPQLADISPDRSELLVANFTGSETDAPLWVLSIPAGTPRRLGNLIGHDGTWSPDGKRLAYANGNQLNVARADGSGSHFLVTAPSPPLWIRWSPDGKVLRFTLADRSLDALLLPHASASSLWEISADGTNFHRLLQGWNNPPAECCGNWTPDGKHFVFQANRQEKTDIWAIREKGFLLRPADREPIRVTAGQIDSRTPVPSVDGTKLFVTGVLAQGELSTFDPKSQQLVPFLSGISAKDVSFSADRKWIAYIAYPQGTLWRSKLDGQDRLQLTFAPMQATMPRWSPDGTQIAFNTFVPGKPWQVYTIPAGGGNPLEVAPAGRSEADPDWSPDGNSLVFGTLPWLETSTPQPVLIYILDLTTHRISSLPGSQGLFSPHWSPDGRYIATLSSDSQRIMLFDFKTQKWSELVHIVAAYPSWSHDGQYVYFNHPGSQPSLMRVRINDRKLEQLISLESPRVRPWSWIGLTPDDSPILMREVGAQEIYAIDWDKR